MKKYKFYFLIALLLFTGSQSFACLDGVATCMKHDRWKGWITVGQLHGGQKVGFCEGGPIGRCFPCEGFDQPNHKHILPEVVATACHKQFPDKCPAPGKVITLYNVCVFWSEFL